MVIIKIRCTKNFDVDSIFLVKIGYYPLLHFLLNHLYFGVIEPVDTNIVTDYQAPLLDNA